MSPEEWLLAGREILNPVLTPHGFQFRLRTVGKGSGGRFAEGEYWRSSRVLELHFQWSLGLVAYRLGSVSTSHEVLLRALHVWGQHAYPGFSDDPLDGFRHLRADIERYARVFLSGGDSELLALLASANQLESERPKGLAGLP